MARKLQKNVRIDSDILSDFERICKKKDISQNVMMEDLMKQFIARDGEELFDNLYSPKIESVVKNAIEGEINRLANMIYQTQTNL